MPIHSVTLPDGTTGYQWGKHGKKYRTRAQAARQAAAAHASGYVGDALKILPPVRPNAGIAASYKRQLVKLIDMIQHGATEAIKSVFVKDIITGLFPAKVIQQRMDSLSFEVGTNMAATAPRLAEWFAQSVKNYSDPALMTILREGGFSVRFQITPAMQNTLDTVIGENVSLITKMSSDHLHEIEELVMRSVQKGGDLHTLHKDLMARYGMTRRRAILIAKDQNNKATSALTRTRYKEIGINQAVWKHSHTGDMVWVNKRDGSKKLELRHARPDHVAADGTIYDIEKGCLISGEFIQPGELVNCKCLPQAIIPALAAWEKK